MSSALRSKILAEAIGIVYAEGPRHVTMRSLAEKLGYSPATIYLHFKNKEELIREIALHGYDRLAEAVAPAAAIDNPAAAVADAARRYVEFGLQNYELYSLMFRDIPPADERPPEELGRVLRARDIGLELYSRGLDRGLFHRIDPLVETIAGWSLLHGFVQLAAEGRMPQNPDGSRPDLRALLDAVLEKRLTAMQR
jgi:AcrR family transcriptional regulator